MKNESELRQYAKDIIKDIFAEDMISRICVIKLIVEAYSKGYNEGYEDALNKHLVE